MTIKKALTFRAASIGDGLMAKYLLENVRAQFPRARLGVVVASRGKMIRDLFAAYPWIEIIETNRRDTKGLVQLWQEFHGAEFVVTQYAGKHGGSFGLASKFFARLLAKRGGLVGFADASRWNDVLYDHLLPIRTDKAVVEHEREALRKAGVPVALPFPTLQFVEDAKVFSKFNVEAGKFVIAHFFAGNASRSVSPERAQAMLQALRLSLPKDTKLVVSGGAADRATAQTIATGIAHTVLIAGEASLQEMMNLINRSLGVVSVDTGVAHMTAQLGKPLIVMRTCLGPNWWFAEQYGVEAPISVFDCDEVCANGHVAKDYPDCINAIDIEKIAGACKNRFVLV